MQKSMTNTVIGAYAPDFELPGADQEVHHLARYLERYRAIGIVFLSNICPVVRQYLPRLQAIQADLQDQDFTLIGINANDLVRSPEDGLEPMGQFAQTHGIIFPYIRDITQDVAHTFQAAKTPEVFLLDQFGIIRYRGAIDDAPENPEAVQEPYLRTAAIALLQNQPVAVPETPAVGSDVLWR